MRVPTPRGPVSAGVADYLAAPEDPSGPSKQTDRLTALHRMLPALPSDREAAEAIVDDEDLQLALWTLYEINYRGFAGVPDREWDPSLLALRLAIERIWEATLRVLTLEAVGAATEARTAGDQPSTGRSADVHDRERVAASIGEVIDSVDGPSLAGYVHRHATADQLRELLVHRSIYHLKESDPHAWVLPRLDGPAKVALAELEYDEYGCGQADRLHSTLFAQALAAAGLDAGYGAHIDVVPAWTLAISNAMSLFGLHRRLRGAAMGHLAAFEMTSSMPCRHYVQGIRRLGLPDAVAAYFDEHVEADAVHEHLASTDICGSLIVDQPELFGDVILGAATCVELDRLVAERTLEAWNTRQTSLRVGALVA